MLFNSVPFLLFFPVVIFLYFLIPFKYRWLWLLAASYFFYGSWKVEYLSLIVISTVVDYTIAMQLVKKKSKTTRRLLLVTSLATNLGILFFFKYFNFFVADTAFVKDLYLHHSNVRAVVDLFTYALPVGISFYTFQTMSYTIDVYQGKAEPEKHFGKFALFVSFFPQLVAGPIERYTHLHPQLMAHHKFTYENFANGLRLMLFGFFVKMCIADNLSAYVDLVYANPAEYGRWSIVTAWVFFSFQIYADFHGYTSIAQGVALIMGIKLMDNFRTPYLAATISEFWHRWHISLSTWFRDYVFIPLGGSRVNFLRWCVNIMVVFIVSGAWHGANYTYMIWGGIHGVLYIIERLGAKVIKLPKEGFSFWRILGIARTFVIVNIAWVYFRADGLRNAQDIFKAFSQNLTDNSLSVDPVVIGLLVFFILLDGILFNKRFDKWVGDKPLSVRWAVYAVLLFAITAMAGSVNHPFIYFQF